MKDLYLQLGINPNASQSDIEAAVANHPDLADTAAILLNDSRRAAYSRTVSTVRSIGMLRHRLGLDNDESWFIEHCPDFAPRLHVKKYAAQAQPVADASTVNTQSGQTDTNKSGTWLKVLLLGAGIAALLLLVNFYL
jgi:hypothetical protein